MVSGEGCQANDHNVNLSRDVRTLPTMFVVTKQDLFLNLTKCFFGALTKPHHDRSVVTTTELQKRKVSTYPWSAKMCITNIYWGDRVASRLQMHASFSAVILLVGVARWKENSTGIKLLTTVCGLWILLGNCVMLSLFMWVPSSSIIYERKAQIPQTQQLTPEQSRWTNNTTGESGEYVPLFLGVNCSFKMLYI